MPSAVRLAWLAFVLGAVACSTSPRSELGRSRGAIIQGTAESGEPAVVKVLLDASGGTATYYCSGTVVGTKTVLTAAHCIELTTLSKTLVEMNGAVHTVARIVRHPAWNKSASAYLNDIGLVILDNVAPVTPQIAAPDLYASRGQFDVDPLDRVRRLQRL